jgi:hypothetical protein
LHPLVKRKAFSFILSIFFLISEKAGFNTALMGEKARVLNG